MKYVVDGFPKQSRVVFGRTDEIVVVLLGGTLDCGKVFRVR